MDRRQEFILIDHADWVFYKYGYQNSKFGNSMIKSVFSLPENQAAYDLGLNDGLIDSENGVHYVDYEHM